MTKQYVYIKVIEAQGIIKDADLCEPFVEIKYNGSTHLHKKCTSCKNGVEWWESTFRFKVKDVNTDWFAVEVRDKSWHMLQSDWIGEIQLKVSAFLEAGISDSWYKLGKGQWKSHNKEPKGYIHLAVQILNNKVERPFSDDFRKMSYEEWLEAGKPTPGMKDLEPTSTHMEQTDPTKLYNRFELTFPTIEEAERTIVKNASKILHDHNYSHDEIAEMKKLNRVNCLKRGNFEDSDGKRYMVAIDGSESAKQAFERSSSSWTSTATISSSSLSENGSFRTTTTNDRVSFCATKFGEPPPELSRSTRTGSIHFTRRSATPRSCRRLTTPEKSSAHSFDDTRSIRSSSESMLPARSKRNLDISDRSPDTAKVTPNAR